MSELLELELRQKTGTGPARSTRRNGMIPGVLYGTGFNPINVAIKDRVFTRLLHVEGIFSSVFDIKVDGKQVKAIVRNISFHPVNDNPISFDFLRVNKKTSTMVSIPVEVVDKDTATAIKNGGILNLIRNTINLVGPVFSMPHVLKIELGDREIGDVLRMSDFKLPKGILPEITDRDFVVATILAPTLETEESSTKEAETSEDDKSSPQNIETTAQKSDKEE